MTTSLFIEGARAFGVELGRAQQDAFECFYREMIAWNARVNLTTITERDEVIVKHWLDSLSVAPHVRAARRLVDVGAGAGFPGLPLKIVLPHLQLTLLEATGKKIAFLRHIIARLDLRDTMAIHARAEDLARQPAHRERYDAAVARAVADLVVLLEYALPFVRVGGVFVALKGSEVEPEIRAAARALDVLGGRVREVVPVRLPGLEPRHLVIVEKMAATPAMYPRRAGVPAHKPLVE